MAEIYKLWFAKYKGAFNALTEAAQNEHLGKVGQALTDAGGKELLMCTSVWADEKWTGWGIEEFPNIEAVQAHTMALWNLDHYRYLKTWSTLGITMPPDEGVKIEKAPLYRVFLMKYTEAWYALSQAEQDQWVTKLGQAHEQFGSKAIMIATSAWAGEEFLAWGVESFPSLEALQGRTLAVNDMGWFKYASATSLLGVPWSMG
jgi:hypothetical protein